ncbi:helix-turn-helix domain-containing protein [Phytohabitans rumicis]|uniref:HTH cro/C1-type domain-containing protein n=1 Tax=Phytohabitans rumicis TaxID=1076125 RepID=A0A6V8LDN8_9ACTN|nr:helix-turn-helix transcriptional regulator [Phytohabitans rumicis]GFJ92206.1 hypothetical protein Prum_058480 [Phytohabitans rumicis]
MPLRIEGNSPSVSLRSRWLGQQLRQLREDRGLTLRFVADGLGVEYAEVAAHEHGRHMFHHGKVAALLDLYRVYDDVERDHLLRLARDAFRLPRWEDDFHAPALDVSRLDFLWLESVADRIRCYSTTLVPDLLRTPSYVEAVVRRESPPMIADEQVRWWVRAFCDRQQILNAATSTEVQAVIAEAALRRPVGGAANTLQVQLAKTADGGSVQARVLPATATYLPGMDGSFTVFELPKPYPNAVACTPHLGGVAIHQERATKWYADVFDRLWRVALPPQDAATLIADAADLLPVNELSEGGH